MEAVKKVQAATRVMITQSKKDPKFQALAKVAAEIETLEKEGEADRGRTGDWIL